MAPRAPRPAVFETPDLDNFVSGPSTRRDTNAMEPNSLANIASFFRESFDFLLTQLDFEVGSDWIPIRMLGAGSYGKVGLWHKSDANNHIIDQLAMKQTARERANEPSSARPGLTNEVVIQTKLNEWTPYTYFPGKIVHLRGYKFSPGPFLNVDNQRPGLSRMYFEFCPYGTLEQLIARYQAWDQYLPEVFIWHVFHDLAVAIQRMSVGTERNHFTGRRYPSSWGVVHLDLKPANIFLGYEHETASAINPNEVEKHPYPTIKISDFGLSQITGRGDSRNPEQLWWTCTPAYQPLEQANAPHIYGSSWPAPRPNGRRLRPNADALEEAEYEKNPGFYFGNAHNIGSLGTCMYDLMNLDLPSRYLKKAIPRRNLRADQRHYEDRGMHVVDDLDIKIGGREVYSQQLRDLVLECLRPSIARRITVAELVAATARGTQNAFAQASATYGDRAAEACKVYFRANEINDMPQGAANFPADGSTLRMIINHKYREPSWGAIKPPAQKWGRLIAATRGTDRSIYTMYQGREFDVDADGKLVFSPDRVQMMAQAQAAVVNLPVQVPQAHTQMTVNTQNQVNQQPAQDLPQNTTLSQTMPNGQTPNRGVVVQNAEQSGTFFDFSHMLTASGQRPPSM